MSWVGKPINPKEPSFNDPDGIAKAVEYHFSYIRRDSHPYIVLLIQELIKFIPIENKLVSSYGGTRFRIGEIGFYPKKGNLYIEVPKSLMDKVKQIADKIFVDTEVLPPAFYDEDLTLMIWLKSLGWH